MYNGETMKNKIGIIVTSAALVSAAASAAYAIWQKKHTEEKVHEAKANTIWQFRCVREQHTFPHPTEQDFKKITGKHCNGIAYQVNIDTYSDNDLGNFSREYAVLILNKLAENMTAGETISEYFARKGNEDNIE